MRISFFVRFLMFSLCGLVVAANATASSYEAALPAGIHGPDLCAYAPCQDVMPQATTFSARKGRPSYVEAYAADDDHDANGHDKDRHDDNDHDAADEKPGKLVGYVFLSTDIVDIPAYSGKPVVTLVGMDVTGTITGVKILKHSEPILLVGIPEAELTKFVAQFVGKHAWDKIEIGKARTDGGYIGIDAISGATVTVIAENQVVMRSAYNVARQVGIVKTETRQQAIFSSLNERRSWEQLVDDGSVGSLVVTAADVGDTETREPLIRMHFGYLNAPSVGRSILGDSAWAQLMSRLGPDDHAIFIVADGRASFKGSGFVRGGIYDRLQIAQDIDTYTFRDRDYFNLYGIEAEGAPTYTESAIYVIRGGGSFSAAYPWSLVFLANKMDKRTGEKVFVNFDSEYWLPDKYLQGGRPEVVRPEATWIRVWKSRAVEIVIFTLFLIAVGVVYSFRETLTRRASRKNKWPVAAFKYTAWAVSIGYIGFYLMAQPSITQVLTWFHSLLFQWTWELFLSDPFIFIFWIFIVVTVFLWGRGLFCGWLCPFGSLTESMYKIAGLVGLKRYQFHMPMKWHNRLKWTKYVIFFVLLTASMFSMVLAEKMAEVEPFKTMFLVGLLERTWPYTLFASVLLGLSLFMERPFCRYLCPLGASLAIPSTFRWFGLKRKQECNTCTACAAGCGSLAIDANGRIDQRECLLCLDCMILYTDAHACPPLVQERKQREKKGLPLTRIAADGYYIPMVEDTSVEAPVSRRAKNGVDPRMPTDPVEPPYATQSSLPLFLMAELRDHLWPWSRAGYRDQPGRQIVGVVALLLTALITGLTLVGWLEPFALIFTWAGWTFLEVMVRMGSRPYVKEGPWWQRNYRRATWMDMFSYVGFKNLLVGTTMFIVLKWSGLLVLM